MSLSKRRAATIKLLAELDQNEREAASIATNPTSTMGERLEARRCLEHFRWAIEKAERVLARMEADQ